MTEQFDVFVIGTGEAGSSAAYACAEAGLKVGIADCRPFGGTCALRGCDPKKVLVGAEEAVDTVRRFQEVGSLAGEVHIDWPKLIRFKRTFTDPVPLNRERSYVESKIATFHGTAEFLAEDRIRIGENEIVSKHFVVATGAVPKDLPIEGKEHLLDNEQFLSLETLQPRIAFVGGGYISFEFAHISARAGSHATIIHQGDRPLEQFDWELVGKLVDATQSLGIDVLVNTPVTRIENTSEGFRVTAGEKTIEVDLVVHGAGRSPDLANLNLRSARVDYSKKGVVVNEWLQSRTNPRVYAAGDAADSGGLPLTPIADHTGTIAAQNIIHGNSKKPNFAEMPSIVFTTPALGAVGITQEEADRQGTRYRLNTGDSSGWYSSRRVNQKTSLYKILIDKSRQRVLGAHVVGPGTEELINLFALAMRFQISSSELAETLMAYPTHGSDLAYML
jgi:glutathione reductase (NADPH)